MRTTYYYLVTVQFLGFRYSGWQKQPGVKTVEGMIVKTLKYILPNSTFKILGAGRTDAKVSALEAAFELYIKEEELGELSEFIRIFNYNLPPDIKVVTISKVNEKFNIINDCKSKEYVYLFSHGSKNHPYSAPFMACIQEELDIELMKEGARIYEGTHNFRAYTPNPSKNAKVNRIVNSCLIAPNEILQASFFPESSYALHIEAQGFLRYQVRKIMGALIQLGKHELKLEQIIDSLSPETNMELNFVAPGSGLMLRSLTFINKV